MVPAKRLIVASVLIVSAFLCSDGTPAWAGLCPDCGGNSATVGDGIVFDELRLGNPVKPEGPAIIAVTGPSSGTPLTLEVNGDHLSAFTADAAHQSVGVTGIVISLKMKDGRAYLVQLEEQRENRRFWAAPQDLLVSYLFKVQKIGRKSDAVPPKDGKYPDDDGPEQGSFDSFLCNHKFPEPELNDPNGQEHGALVFTGDHYSETHVVSRQERGTFNLACFGTASAKMHLLRHTTAGTASGSRGTTAAQRTAMLRAITADYCGDGHAWTQDGTPLWWTDRGQTFPLTSQPGFIERTPMPSPTQIEAVWGENGLLLCLNEPRRTPAPARKIDPNTCSAPAVTRNMVTTGRHSCPGMRRLPHCTDFPWSDRLRNPWEDVPLSPGPTPAGKRMTGAYVVTVNAPSDANYCAHPLKSKGGP